MGENTTWREVPPPRRRRVVLGWLIAVVAVIGGVAVAAWSVGHRNTSNGPEALVRTYAEHLAAGRAAAAGAIVAPTPKSGATLDPTLLTDGVVGGAVRRLTVVEVASYDADETTVGQSATVHVRYTVDGQPNQVTLHAQRLPNTWGVLRHWRLVDGLAVPVVIETNIESIPTGRLGTATITVSGSGLQGFPQHRFMLYPGVYHVTGVDSPWITAAKDVTVDDNRTHDLSDVSPTGQVWYEATDALMKKVQADATAQARACAATGPSMAIRGCPMEMWLRDDFGTLRVTRAPVIDSVQAYQTTYEADGTTLPAMRFTSTEGEFSYSGGPGIEPDTQSFRSEGGVSFSADGRSARVDLWTSLSGPGR